MSERLRCGTCLRPRSSCICRWITPVAHEVEVLILQHPLELAQAKGSARLLHLSLMRSRMLTGEVFAADDLPAVPLGSESAAAHAPRHNLLLYPDTPPGSTPLLPAPPALAPELLQPARLRLVVLDGTWRKSRKMLYLNPWLQHLPRLALQDMPGSNYLIRRAHKPDQLSTLEATCAALAQLEGDAERFRPLLDAFDGFVAQQMSYAGPSSK
ncbi:tRNA-uridine aminocarboxypropyltransferase [Polaromonas sp.]|uniref:tRNA-uridine aminocarboxypropyltransferase n=1 Tax=Polaromonas sp. TaxID=1869339 RepID=UPI0032675582